MRGGASLPSSTNRIRLDSMLPENDIVVSPHKISKNASELTLSHSSVGDLLGEVQTVFIAPNCAFVSARIYERSRIIFEEKIDVCKNGDQVGGVPHKIAVTNAQKALVAKVKMIMTGVAVARQVTEEERSPFIKMLENTSRAFPHLPREQSMRLALDALNAKRKRQLAPVFAEDE
jgi:hypothetical protein